MEWVNEYWAHSKSLAFTFTGPIVTVTWKSPWMERRTNNVCFMYRLDSRDCVGSGCAPECGEAILVLYPFWKTFRWTHTKQQNIHIHVRARTHNFWKLFFTKFIWMYFLVYASSSYFNCTAQPRILYAHICTVAVSLWMVCVCVSVRKR